MINSSCWMIWIWLLTQKIKIFAKVSFKFRCFVFLPGKISWKELPSHSPLLFQKNALIRCTSFDNIFHNVGDSYFVSAVPSWYSGLNYFKLFSLLNLLLLLNGNMFIKYPNRFFYSAKNWMNLCNFLCHYNFWPFFCFCCHSKFSITLKVSMSIPYGLTENFKVKILKAFQTDIFRRMSSH